MPLKIIFVVLVFAQGLIQMDLRLHCHPMWHCAKLAALQTLPGFSATPWDTPQDKAWALEQPPWLEQAL